MDLDIDILRVEDDDVLFPGIEPFPRVEIAGGNLPTLIAEVPRDDESSETVGAPLARKPRAPRQLPFDERQELHNADLAQWKADYAMNMAQAVEARKNQKALNVAKKNAAFWVKGTGIGGVGAGLGSSKLKSPLDMFAGEPMMEALTGTKASKPGLKRGRESDRDHDSGSEARRVRVRDDDGHQIGRGDELMLNDNDGALMISGDEARPQKHVA